MLPIKNFIFCERNIMKIKSIVLLISPILLSMSFSMTSYAKEKCGCEKEIFQLQENNFALEKRITALENKISNMNSQPSSVIVNPPANPQASPSPWVCSYTGFDSTKIGYSAVGATRAIAEMKASEKCKKKDKNKGFFCHLDKCEQ